MRETILYLICPCYNEEEVLKSGFTFKKLENIMLELMQEGLCSNKSRVLMVNDGSTDSTAELISEKHKENHMFSYINLSRNFGHQYALLCGLMSIKDIADVTITIDADLQQDPNAIKEFMVKYHEGYEIVYGVRKDRESDGFFKKYSAQLYYGIMRTVCGCNIIKNHADYRLLSKKAVEALSEFEETNMFLRGLIPMLGYKSCIVYHDVYRREYGTSKYSLRKMFALAADGITSLSTGPIRMVFYSGMLISVISLIVIVFYFIAFLLGKNVSGWTSLIMSMWMLGGLIMVSIGCIGEYIGKLYLESKKRPRYIIDSFCNDEEYECEKP